MLLPLIIGALGLGACGNPSQIYMATNRAMSSYIAPSGSAKTLIAKQPLTPVKRTKLPRPKPVKPAWVAPNSATPIPPPTLAYYSCRAIMDLWIDEGGNPNAAFIAAEIATAESGGNSRIVSPEDSNGTYDYGLWQINSSHYPADPQIYLNPMVNARAAIAISYNGSDWLAWTTYRKGLYIGLC